MSKKKIKRKQQYKRPKERTFKEWWQDQTEKTRKNILIAAIAAAAVIVLALVWYYGIYDDGSLRVSRGAIANAQENWLVGERSGGKNSKYYHLADVEVPEGYTKSEESMAGNSSALRTDFSFLPAEEGGISVYVAPVKNSIQDMLDSVYPTFSNMVAETGSITEISDYSGKLGDCRYFGYQQQYEDENGATRYSQSLVMYAPSRYKDTCILISSNYAPADADGFLPAETMLAEVVKAMEGITVIEK